MPDNSPDQGGLNSKLYAVCDGEGRPLAMLLTEGQTSDYKGVVMMLEALPKARVLLGDQGYDADWFRGALIAKGIIPCILNRRSAWPVFLSQTRLMPSYTIMPQAR